MQYIILDLEWNQPISFYSTTFKRVGDALQFELIQMGAVKLDSERRLISSFSQDIKPSQYKKIHPRIRRITGITQEDIDFAPQFDQAMERFIKWCGEEYMLFSWGGDDISILDQNLRFFGIDKKLVIYDLQELFGHVRGNTKNRFGLRNALEAIGIRQSNEHPFHRAVDDAYYAALIFQRLPKDVKLDMFKTNARKLTCRVNKTARAKSSMISVKNVKSALRSKETLFPDCPICGRKTSISEGYLPNGDSNYYMGLSDCEKHGLIFNKLHFIKRGSGYIVRRKSELSEEQHPAYVRTKHLQWTEKLANFERKVKI